MLNFLVFRQPVQVDKGMRTLPDLPWKYEHFQIYLKTWSLATRFKDMYDIRQATGNIMNGMKQNCLTTNLAVSQFIEVSKYERMQVVAHSSLETFDCSHLSQYV